ncbi:MAG: type II toxin-antitoxin system RelE/ParE family toxin [Pseudomonadota bacterium]
MRLEWSALAIADREEVFDYIAAENPAAAVKLDERISERVQDLVQFPASGRMGRVAGTRELVIAGTPYIAAYRIVGNVVRVLRVLHGAQMWPGRLPE